MRLYPLPKNFNFIFQLVEGFIGLLCIFPQVSSHCYDSLDLEIELEAFLRYVGEDLNRVLVLLAATYEIQTRVHLFTVFNATLNAQTAELTLIFKKNDSGDAS